MNFKMYFLATPRDVKLCIDFLTHVGSIFDVSGKAEISKNYDNKTYSFFTRLGMSNVLY